MWVFAVAWQVFPTSRAASATNRRTRNNIMPIHSKVSVWCDGRHISMHTSTDIQASPARVGRERAAYIMPA